MKDYKKIGLVSSILMGIGAIIGIGIFGSLPTAVQLAGDGTVLWVMLGAFVVVMLKSFPILATTAALPASGANYLHCAKLISPWVGYLQLINGLFNVLTIVLFAQLFAEYFVSLFPDLDEFAVAIAFLLLMSALGCFGIKLNSTLQNIMVILLIVALALYIVLGLEAIDPANLSLGEVLTPSMSLSGFVAAVAVMQSATFGAHTMVNFADDIRNPGRTLPLAISISPLVVTVIYILMAAVTVGTVPEVGDMSLADIAAGYMPGYLVTVFVVIGPIFAILTSTIPMMISMTNILAMCANDRILPEVFSRCNRHGVYYVSHLFNCAIALAIVLFRIPTGTAFSAFSMFSLVTAISLFIPPLVMHKRYPKCAAHAPFRLGKAANWTLNILGIAVSVYLVIESLDEMGTTMWIIFIVTVLLCYAYFAARIVYLKGKGFDLLAQMSKPYEPWEKLEASYEWSKLST